jgi:hypothetical protein
MATAFNQKVDLQRLTKTATALVAMKMVRVTEKCFEVEMPSVRGQKLVYEVVAVEERLMCTCFTFSDNGVCSHTIASEMFAAQILDEQTADNVAPLFLEITPEAVAAAIERANRQSYIAFVTGTNSDRDVFEVYSASSGKSYTVEIKEMVDGRILGRCSCADFINRNRVCKHQSLIATTRSLTPIALAA